MIQDFPLILLAGGKSSRMGTPKGLLDYQGNLWLLEQLSRYRAAAGKRVVVVLGFYCEQYFEKIPWLRAAQKKPIHQLGLEITVVVNPTPEYGQFSSLQCALSILSIGLPVPGVFILPVDVPGPEKEVYEKLAEALDAKTATVIPRYQSKGGHPVLLSKAFLGHLGKVSLSSPEARLDFQIKVLPRDRVAFVPVDSQEVGLNMNFLDEFRSYSLKEGIFSPEKESQSRNYPTSELYF
jgi:CTP:molybdopterin cytidylyltransferase MocA